MSLALAMLCVPRALSAAPALFEHYELLVEPEGAPEERYWLIHFRAGHGTDFDPDTTFVLSQLARFVGYVYLHGGLFDERTRATMNRGTRAIEEGQVSIVAVTRLRDPLQPYHAIAIAPEGPRGVPVEARLEGRGVTKVPREPLAVTPKVPVIHVDRTGVLAEIPEVTAYLSRRPWYTGGPGSHAELTKLAKAENTPRDFSRVLYDALLAFGLTLWGDDLPGTARLPPLTGELAEEAVRLATKYPHLTPELLYPERQRRTLLTHLNAHAAGAGRDALYRRFFGFPKAVQSFYDEDMLIDGTLLSLERPIWERVPGERISARVEKVKATLLPPPTNVRPLDNYRSWDARRPHEYYARTPTVRGGCSEEMAAYGRTIPLRYYPGPPRRPRKKP